MRVYRNYDHRLKRAIGKAGDPGLFRQLEIPPSTAKGSIRKGVPFVVTADEFDQDTGVLVIENQRLRNELARIEATQELQSFTFKLFGLQIQYRRLPLADSGLDSGSHRQVRLAETGTPHVHTIRPDCRHHAGQLWAVVGAFSGHQSQSDQSRPTINRQVITSG